MEIKVQHIADANNKKIWWLQTQALKPARIMIFLHGFPDNAYVWSKQITDFSIDSICIAPFVAGTYNGDQYEIADSNAKAQIENIKKILDTLKFDLPIVVIGHDMGGPVAHNLCNFLGERVNCLVVINSLCFEAFFARRKNILQVWRSSYMFLFQLPLLDDWFFKKAAKKIFKFIYDKGGLDADDELRNSPWYSLKGINVYRLSIKDVKKKLKYKNIPYKMPTLFIWGEKDPFLITPTIQELNKYYLNVNIKKLSTSHWPMRTQERQVNQMIRSFLGDKI